MTVTALQAFNVESICGVLLRLVESCQRAVPTPGEIDVKGVIRVSKWLRQSDCTGPNTCSTDTESRIGLSAPRASRKPRVCSAEILPLFSAMSRELRTSTDQKAGTSADSPVFNRPSIFRDRGVCSSGKHQESVIEASTTIPLKDGPQRVIPGSSCRQVRGHVSCRNS